MTMQAYCFSALLLAGVISSAEGASSLPPQSKDRGALQALSAAPPISAPQALPAGSVVFARDLNFNGDNGPFSDFNQQIADSFTLTGSESVTGATWYGNFLGQGDPYDVGDTWNFTVRFFSDNGGVPSDSPLASASVTATIEQEAGVQDGDTAYLFSADFSPVALAAGTTYYFAVLSSTNNSFRWNNGAPTDGFLTVRNGDSGAWRSSVEDPRAASAFALYGGEGADVAQFKVTKTFSDDNDASVDVTLTCNSGLPLEQTFTIDGGDLDGVTFVVTDIPESGASCTVTETGGPAGYTPEFSGTGGQGCLWGDVTVGFYNCVITNTADDATYTVVKDWVQAGTGGDLVDATAKVTIKCDAMIDGYMGNGYETAGSKNRLQVAIPPSNVWYDNGYWYKSGDLGDGDTLEAAVDVTGGEAECSASETITQSGVESAAEGCGPTTLGAGGSATCTFTNTVFFEGIPTLSQWGIALMVLLMLGVGFIGFRRIV